MDLTAYLDLARERSGLTSDRQLAQRLDVSQTTLRQYRLGLAQPRPEAMVRLAALACVSPELALLHRATWEADGQASRAVMSRILAQFSEETPRNVLNGPRSLGAAASPAACNNGRTRYIMERVRLWILELITGLSRDPLPAAA